MAVNDESMPYQARFPGRNRASRLPRAQSGVSLIEILIAVAVLALALTAMISGISYMRIQNRMSSQRMLAGSVAAQILEMYKALPFSVITSSTGGGICLEGYGTGTPDTNWTVPAVGMSGTLPVEDVTSSTPGYPSLVTNKLPGGKWTVALTPVITTGSGATPLVEQITVTVTWDINQGASVAPCTYSLSTMVNSYYPNL